MNRRAFSLVEMVISLSVVGVISTALVSTMVLAARATPRPNDAVSTTLAASRAAARLSDELGASMYVGYADSKAVEFYIADTTGDAVEETVRWEWSGNKGDPVVRWFNGVPSNVVTGVQDFDLRFAVRDDTLDSPGAAADGAEQLLCSFDDGDSSTVTLSSTRRVGQFFTPLLPSDATRYSVTRVVVRFTTIPLLSSITMDICPAKADGSPSTALAGATVGSLNLVGGGTVEFSFGSITNRTAGTGLWFVLRQTSLFAKVGVQTKVADGGALYGVSDNSGTSWTQTSDSSLRYYVYGRVKRPTVVSTPIQRAEAATIRIRTGSDTKTATSTGCAFLTSPQITLVDPASGETAAEPESKGVIAGVLDLLF